MPTKTNLDPRLAAFTDDEIRAEYMARIYGRVDILSARCTGAQRAQRRDAPNHTDPPGFPGLNGYPNSTHRCAECRYCGRGRCTSTQVYPNSTVCFLQSKKIPGIYYAVVPTHPACLEFQPKQQTEQS